MQTLILTEVSNPSFIVFEYFFFQTTFSVKGKLKTQFGISKSEYTWWSSNRIFYLIFLSKLIFSLKVDKQITASHILEGIQSRSLACWISFASLSEYPNVFIVLVENWIFNHQQYYVETCGIWTIDLLKDSKSFLLQKGWSRRSLEYVPWVDTFGVLSFNWHKGSIEVKKL